MSENVNRRYSYKAFGLNISSQIPVTGFEPVQFNKSDVLISTGKVPAKLNQAEKYGILFQSSENEFLLKIENVASYHVRNGNEIIVEPVGVPTEGIVSAFLIGTAFGALLQQRNLLALHASAVSYCGRCLVFAGLSGSGKSTLAAALISKGGTLIADDVSVIDISGIRPNVLPAFPCIKIWDDSLKNLGMKSEGLASVRNELKKYYMPVEQYNGKSQEIDYIFILSSHNKSEIDIRLLQGTDKFNGLKKHTYMFRSLAGIHLQTTHFNLINRVALQLPVYLLIRPDCGFGLDKLIDRIVQTAELKTHE
jgi:hypothetical protein